MTRTWNAAVSAAILALLAACGGGDDDPAGTETGATPTAASRLVTEDFNRGTTGWTGESADYSTSTAPTEVAFGQRSIKDLGYPDGTNAYYIGGHNNSDDALLYIKKQYTGFVANTEYTVTIQAANFLTNAPTGCMGVGGAPGESVYVIAAASPTEPKPVDTNGEIRLNIDRGNQGTAGTASMLLGNIANGLPCDGTTKYAAKLSKNTTGVKVKTDASGNIWVVFGIDSGFEATSSIYLQSLIIGFVPVVATTT